MCKSLFPSWAYHLPLKAFFSVNLEWGNGSYIDNIFRVVYSSLYRHSEQGKICTINLVPTEPRLLYIEFGSNLVIVVLN